MSVASYVFSVALKCIVSLALNSKCSGSGLGLALESLMVSSMEPPSFIP